MSNKATTVIVNTQAVKHGFKVFNRRNSHVAGGYLSPVFGKSTEWLPSVWQRDPSREPVFGFSNLFLAKSWMVTLLRERPDLELWRVEYIPFSSLIAPLVLSPSKCRALHIRVRQGKRDLWSFIKAPNMVALSTNVQRGLYKPAPLGTVMMESVRPISKVFSI